MAGFLFFLPGAPVANPATIEKFGLAPALGGASLITVGSAAAPEDAAAGLVVALTKSKPKKFRFDAAAQTWRRAPGRDYFVGWQTAEPPLPAEMLRDDAIGGHKVRMEDGSEWLVPVARSIYPGRELPSELRVGPDGELVRQGLDRFADYCAACDKAFARWRYEANLMLRAEDEDDDSILTAPDDPDAPPILDEREVFDIAVAGLALNYHVDAAILACWPAPLLTTRNIDDVKEAAIDIPTIVQLGRKMAEARTADAKKNFDKPTPVGSATGDGGLASRPAISPPSQTSIG